METKLLKTYCREVLDELGVKYNGIDSDEERHVLIHTDFEHGYINMEFYEKPLLIEASVCFSAYKTGTPEKTIKNMQYLISKNKELAKKGYHGEFSEPDQDAKDYNYKAKLDSRQSLEKLIQDFNFSKTAKKK